MLDPLPHKLSSNSLFLALRTTTETETETETIETETETAQECFGRFIVGLPLCALVLSSVKCFSRFRWQPAHPHHARRSQQKHRCEAQSWQLEVPPPEVRGGGRIRRMATAAMAQWHSYKRSQSRRRRQVTSKCPSCRNRNWQNRKCTACRWIWNPQGLEPTGHLPKTAAVAVEAVRGEQGGNLVVRGARHENPGRRPENRALTTLECHSGNSFALRISPGRWRTGNPPGKVLFAIFFLGPLLRRIDMKCLLNDLFSCLSGEHQKR